MKTLNNNLTNYLKILALQFIAISSFLICFLSVDNAPTGEGVAILAIIALTGSVHLATKLVNKNLVDDERKANIANMHKLAMELNASEERNKELINRLAVIDGHILNHKIRADKAEERAHKAVNARNEANKRDSATQLEMSNLRAEFNKRVREAVKAEVAHLDVAKVGYVYLLKCSDHNLVKVGETQREPERRLRELNKVCYGGHNDWRIHKVYRTKDRAYSESTAHSALRGQKVRIGSYKECFFTDVYTAQHIIDNALINHQI